MANVQTVPFRKTAPTWQLAVARVLKASTEQTGVQTKSAQEWVPVLTLAAVDLVIDLATRTFNVSPETKPLLETLVLEYLVTGVQQGGPAP